MKKIFFLFAIIISSLPVFSQILEPATWTTSTSSKEVKTGDEVDLIFTAKIIKDWYLYSSDFDPECGPMVTTFTFEPNSTYELVGDIQAINPTEKYDDIFECTVRIFKKTGVFRQTIKVLSTDLHVSGNYEYQVCSDVDGKCIPFDDDFSFNEISVKGPKTTIPPKEKKENEAPQKEAPNKAESTDSRKDQIRDDNDQAKEASIKEDSSRVVPKDYSTAVNSGPKLDEKVTGNIDKEKESILAFMIIAFFAGLATLLTPCVFPMIPMTVTFFLKGSGASRGKAIRDGVFFGLSIIFIYTILGTLFAVLLGPEGLNALATNWILNLFVFAIFFIFALSFLGLFDITLPSSLVNKIDKQSERGGLVGIFFMATTLAVVSFSCTVPIAGSILFLSAQGELILPIAGMFAYSFAFAVPFALFSIFPKWLSGLPKSGGWLNSVKVVLGLLELALAFKFLSIADQAYHWGILDREINIGIWIVIFTLMGFYLLGKIRLPHDNKLEVISVPRLMMAIATFSFVLYLIPGMWGAPLKALAGYLPPMYTHDFDLISLARPADEAQYAACGEPKYGDFLHLPHGLNGYFDYDQALACARKQNKPLFIDFTGHGCTNCREMEAVVWSDPEVLRRLKEDYVIVALYVDDKTELPESAWYTSRYDGKVKKTIGKQNADLQISNLDNNAQPFYVLVGLDETVLVKPVTYDKDVQNFIKFLDEGSEKFEELYN